jgi:rhamnosyl/mannosyltransferase
MESTVFELTEGLNRAGWSTDVLCANRGPSTVEEQWPAGYDVVRAGSFGTWLSTSVSPALLGATARLAPNYQIIHVHMPDPAAALALWYTRPRARLVVHWHSDVIRQRKALMLYEPLQRWLLRRADRIVATSMAYAHASEALAPWQGKVEVIPLGIGDNLARSCNDSAAALRARHPGKKLVFALGRMAYYKGFDVLIDAATHLPDDAVVLVGGGGELLDRHRAQVAALGLDSKVHFLGPVANDELMTYHAAADVFCLPSTARSEAFGVAMLEAMSAGKPVVASDIGGSGVPWVNQHGVTGLNVPPADAKALSAALRQVLGDSALAARLGQAGRHRYLEHFTAAHMIRRVVELYGRLAAA